MDISTIVGVIFGIIAVFLGMFIKGADMSVLINPAAFLIIILGTIASSNNWFPYERIKKGAKSI